MVSVNCGRVDKNDAEKGGCLGRPASNEIGEGLRPGEEQCRARNVDS